MSVLRIVFLADTHLGFDYPVKPRVERRRRGPDFFANFRQVLAYARQTRPDLVLHGGDLFFRARVPPKIVDLVYADLFDFAGGGIPIIIVPGNHERSMLPISLFLNHPNIYVFDRPKTLDFNFRNVKVNLAGFPCERKAARGKFSALLNSSGWYEQDAEIKLLCIHQTIEGAQVGPANYTFRSGKDVIQRQDLPGDAAAVLCGHIHRQQVLGDPADLRAESPPVIYPGSTERTSFAERDESKGFYEIEFTEDKGSWVIRRLKFIELPARPMENLTLDGKVTPENLGDFIHSKITFMAPDSIVRLRCDPKTDPEVISMVTSKFLREILPDSMNYQFSAGFRQRLLDGN
jgi:DNA repair exonuclease SbcCD nuclease subunit